MNSQTKDVEMDDVNYWRQRAFNAENALQTMSAVAPAVTRLLETVLAMELRLAECEVRLKVKGKKSE